MQWDTVFHHHFYHQHHHHHNYQHHYHGHLQDYMTILITIKNKNNSHQHHYQHQQEQQQQPQSHHYHHRHRATCHYCQYHQHHHVFCWQHDIKDPPPFQASNPQKKLQHALEDQIYSVMRKARLLGSLRYCTVLYSPSTHPSTPCHPCPSGNFLPLCCPL